MANERQGYNVDSQEVRQNESCGTSEVNSGIITSGSSLHREGHGRGSRRQIPPEGPTRGQQTNTVRISDNSDRNTSNIESEILRESSSPELFTRRTNHLRLGSATSWRTNNEGVLSDLGVEEEVVDDKFLIPILPMETAVICCALNFLTPGLGTVIAGISSLFCAKPKDSTKRQSCGSCLLTTGIGVLQLLMVPCFLIGWVWSGMWGVSLVGMSMDYYQDDIRSHWRGSRRPRSTLIYPLRARSNIRYHSPPPPYEMYSSPPPGYHAETNEVLQEILRSQNDTATSNGQAVRSTGRERPTFWQCNVCRKQYSIGNKKFKCHRCFESVCADCFTKPIVAPSGQRITVCDQCYGEIGVSALIQPVDTSQTPDQ